MWGERHVSHKKKKLKIKNLKLLKLEFKFETKI